MRKKHVLDVAMAVRKAAERLVKDDNPGPAWGPDLGGSCGDCSYVLAQMLGDRYLYEEGAYDGDQHSWVRLRDGTIVDVTATQFRIRRRVHVTRSRKYSTELRRTSAVRNLYTWGDVGWRRELKSLAMKILEGRDA